LKEKKNRHNRKSSPLNIRIQWIYQNITLNWKALEVSKPKL